MRMLVSPIPHIPQRSPLLLLAAFLLLSGCDDSSVRPAPRAQLPGALLSVALRQAVETGDLDLAGALLDEGADVSQSAGGRSLLHVAVSDGREEIAGLLLERGADVNARDLKGRTPLHHAALEGHLDLMRLLIAAGADVNAKDNQGRSVLDAAGHGAFAVSKDLEVTPGTVVCIDAKTTCGLVVSTKAYDCTVAGVVSGAGGIDTGMKLGHDARSEGRDYPIALTGRVYCLVDATQEPVAPGDFLTTSNTPGHAMKAVDLTRGRGAIIGKAMSRLSSGKGFVLVLVSLQ